MQPPSLGDQDFAVAQAGADRGAKDAAGAAVMAMLEAIAVADGRAALWFCGRVGDFAFFAVQFADLCINRLNELDNRRG